MDKEQFNQKIFNKFKIKEIALINTNIYYNEKYVDYYMKYNLGEYEYCYKFLNDNRNLLTIENTPKGMKTTAKKMLKNAKKLF